MAASLTINDLNEYSEKLEKLVEDVNSYSTFVETGTSYGASIQSVYQYFEKMWTVELSDELYAYGKRVTDKIPHCTHVKGDSLIELPKYLQDLSAEEKVFFWLDAHYSSMNTARNHLDCPLIEECVAIDKNYQGDSAIVVIDDVRLFGTNVNEDWSYISEEGVQNSFDNYDIKFYEIINDRLLLYIVRK